MMENEVNGLGALTMTQPSEKEPVDDKFGEKAANVSREDGFFNLKIHHGGVYFGPAEEKYVGGSIEEIEGVIASEIKKSHLYDFCSILGYTEKAKLAYGVPFEDCEMKFQKIETEDDVAKMAAIGVKMGKVEIYVIQEFHIRFVDGSNKSSKDNISEVGVAKDDVFYVDITFDDSTTFQDTQIPVDVIGEVEECEVDHDSQSESSEAESFNDSDYDLSKDEDAAIFRNSIAAADPNLEALGEKDGAPGMVGSSVPTKDNTQTARKKASNHKNSDDHVDECVAFSIYDEDQIPVHEESDSMNSKELNSDCDSSDEGSSRKKKARYVRFNPKVDMQDPKLFVGLLFDDKTIFKTAIDFYGVKWGKELGWVKNDIRRMRSKCKVESCGWFAYASKEPNSNAFVIRTMGPEHQCGRTFYHKKANSGFLARHYVDFLRMNKKVTVNEFKDKVHLELNVNITKDQVYKTFMKSKILIHGRYKQQYTKLWDYCEELLKHNPGSTVHMETCTNDESGKERFERLYICFEALKRGFKAGCRRVVGVDGCHLRGPHPGVLLTAVGIDANDCIYPIAYAVVEVENKKTWKWFIEFLKYDLQIYDQMNWTLISDRQKGLGFAIQEVIPGVEHRHCVRHLHNNMKKLHPGQTIKDRFWACARSSYIRRYENEMEALRVYDQNAHKWLIDNTNPRHWSRSHFRIEPKCDMLLNNLCESFNSVILDAREKPILGMLENIRIYLMERMRTKREWMKKRIDAICPKIQKKLEKAKFEAAANIARPSDDKRYEVTHIYGGTYVVDLENCTCSCRRWELTGIPCCHAICCISMTGKTPEQYVHRCYSRETFLDAYEPAISPINGPNAWTASKKIPLLPPKKLRLPGRPKMARRREPDESRPNSRGVTKLSRVGITRLSCSKCHEKGHTVRKCPLVIPPADLLNHGNGRGPSFNTNKCSKCGGLGHNKRTCPQSISERQTGAATDELNQSAADERAAHCDESTHQETPDTQPSPNQDNVAEVLNRDPQQNDSSVNVQAEMEVDIIDIGLSGPEQLSNPKKSVKCSFCRALGHNRKTCPSKQAQGWRQRKAAMDTYGPYVESVGKKPRTKKRAHKIMDEPDEEDEDLGASHG